jgi:Ala-tRNA(Pro) deacylase
VEPGSVTPFGAINDREGRVTVALDAALLAHGTVNFHPLTNTATTAISAEDLKRFLEATGHPPLVIDLATD